jgi:hypothetical protein
MVLIIEIVNSTLGYFFENDVKNGSDLKTFFKIFNCKLTYIMIIFTIIDIQITYSLRTISDLENAVPQKWSRGKG